VATSGHHEAASAAVEIRSVDYVPDGERHGGVASQFTLWLGANLQVTAIVTGALAVVLGGDVFWSLIALGLGQVIGGAVMALHGAQGPQLGLPQMISSRVQFGVYGAIIPIVAVCLMYIGFSASGSVLAGQAIGQLLGVDAGIGIAIFGGFIVIVTLFGYRLIHMLGRVASVVGVAALPIYVQQAVCGPPDRRVAERTAFRAQPVSVGDVLVSIVADCLWAVCGGLFALSASQHLLPRYLRRGGPWGRLWAHRYP